MGDLPGGRKRRAPAADRNVEPICAVLADWLPERGFVLEVASGTGQHAVEFARRFPTLDWQPSDKDQAALESIAAWRSEAGEDNLLEPIRIDASQPDWPIERADIVLSINMVHIAPWTCAEGLMSESARILGNDGALILYGPWLKDDVETAPSNLAFDAELKSRNPAWGLRRVEDFEELAKSSGFALVETRSMPANNIMLLFRHSGRPTET